MSRPGLLEGYGVPLRLHVLDTVGVVTVSVWQVAAIPLSVLLVKLEAASGLIPRDAGIVMLLIGINLVALEYGVTWILIASCRRLAVLFGMASEKEAAFFPIPCLKTVASPWPQEWQQPIPEYERDRISNTRPMPKRSRIVEVLFPFGCWWHDRVRQAKETGDAEFLRLERRLMGLVVFISLLALIVVLTTW